MPQFGNVINIMNSLRQAQLSDQPLDEQAESMPAHNIVTNRPRTRQPFGLSTRSQSSTPSFDATRSDTDPSIGLPSDITDVPSPDTPQISGFKKFLASMLIATNPRLANVIMQGGFAEFEKNRQEGVDLEERKFTEPSANAQLQAETSRRNADVNVESRLEAARIRTEGGGDQFQDLLAPVDLVVEDANGNKFRQFNQRTKSGGVGSSQFQPMNPSGPQTPTFPIRKLTNFQQVKLPNGQTALIDPTGTFPPFIVPEAGGIGRPSAAAGTGALGDAASGVPGVDLSQPLIREASQKDTEVAGNLSELTTFIELFEGFAADFGNTQLQSGVIGQAGTFLGEQFNRSDLTRPLVEMNASPDFNRLLGMRQRIVRQLALMSDRGRLSDFDLEQVATSVPFIATLTTSEGRETFGAKMEQFKNELFRRMLRQSQLVPGAFTPEEIGQLKKSAIDNGTPFIRRSQIQQVLESEGEQAAQKLELDAIKQDVTILEDE